MTQPSQGAPTAAAIATPVAQSGWLTATKVLIATTLVLAGAGGAAVSGFIASVLYSGCFLTCSERNPVGGALFGLLALALLVGGGVLAYVMWRRARTWRAVRIWGVVLLSLPVLLQVGGF